ncbi:hypothetical protein BJX76DRAFT_23866 [Aspergillus varians]
MCSSHFLQMLVSIVHRPSSIVTSVRTTTASPLPFSLSSLYFLAQELDSRVCHCQCRLSVKVPPATLISFFFDCSPHSPPSPLLHFSQTTRRRPILPRPKQSAPFFNRDLATEYRRTTPLLLHRVPNPYLAAHHQSQSLLFVLRLLFLLGHRNSPPPQSCLVLQLFFL